MGKSMRSYEERRQEHRDGDPREDRLPGWVKERLNALRSMIRYAEREAQDGQRLLESADKVGVGIPGPEVSMYVCLDAPLHDAFLPLPEGSAVVVRLRGGGELNVQPGTKAKADQMCVWSDGAGVLTVTPTGANTVDMGVAQ